MTSRQAEKLAAAQGVEVLNESSVAGRDLLLLPGHAIRPHHLIVFMVDYMTVPNIGSLLSDRTHTNSFPCRNGWQSGRRPTAGRSPHQSFDIRVQVPLPLE
jgi:hypothetical protein